MTCLHLLGQIRVNKLRLLSGGGVRYIADGCVYLLFINSSLKGNRDSVLRCMAEEWGLWILSFWERIQFWGPAHFCECLKKTHFSRPHR